MFVEIPFTKVILIAEYSNGINHASGKHTNTS